MADRTTLSKPLRVGVVGCGKIARSLHIPGYLNSSKAQLTSLYNRRLESMSDLADRLPGVSIYDDYQQFLEEGRVEAVSICTPNALHAPMAIEAMKRGVHVLVEKPIAVTLSEARRMIDAANRYGVVLTVAQNQRFLPHNVEIQKLLQTGALGNIHHIRATFAHGGPERWSPGNNWFRDSRLGVLGVVGDLMVHKADLVRFLTLQEAISIAAFDDSNGHTAGATNAVAVLTMSGGTLVTLEVGWSSRGRRLDQLTVIGEGGTLCSDRDEEPPLIYYDARGTRTVVKPPSTSRREPGVLPYEIVSAFIAAVLGTARNPVPPGEGYRALEICIAALRSARNHEVISLPLENKGGR